MAVGKNLSWQFIIGKPMVVLGKTYFGSFKVVIILWDLQFTILYFFGKTRSLAGKNPLGKPMVGWEKPLLAVVLLGKPMVGWEKPMFGS